VKQKDKNKNYSGKKRTKMRTITCGKKRNLKIWANHTAILCQPDVTQQ